MFEKLLKWMRGLLNRLFEDAVGSPDILISGKMESALPLWVAIYESGGPGAARKRTSTAWGWAPPSPGSSAAW